MNYFDDPKTYKSFELPGARPHYNPDKPGQVQLIFLDLTLDIPNQSLAGVCQIELNPIRSGIKRLELNAVNLNIQKVTINGIVQNYTYNGQILEIETPPTEIEQNLEIAITYSVSYPQRGIYFITPSKDYPHKPTQVWTQGEDEDSRYWFPCFDYPGQLASSRVRVRVVKPLVAISNGALTETQEDGDYIIYDWCQKEIHPNYLITLAVGDFAQIQDQWDNIPVTYYVAKGREADATRSMGKTPSMIQFLSEFFGYRYPYQKYAQVCVDDFIFGGMENTSTTILTDRCLLDERASLDDQFTESLVVHELTHQWFGDLVVIKHWSHAWIKEGMASYSESLWVEQEYGGVHGAYYRLGDQRSYLNEDSSRYRRPMVTNVYCEAIELYDRHIYQKGACVYHIIRAELGDELFRKAIKTFIEDNAFSTVETVDLLRAIEKATGRNLLPLFDQYVYRGGHPDFKIKYSWDSENKLALLTVTQTQANSDSTYQELFDLKIPIAFGSVSDDQTVTLQKFNIRIYQAEQTFYFPLTDQPSFISFDHGNHYLKTVKLEIGLPELQSQILYDPDPISRIYAAQALAEKGNLEAIKALSSALNKEQFWGVRLEIIKELGKIKLNQAVSIIVSALSDEHPKVRRAAVNTLATIKTYESYKALKPIVKQGDPSYYVEADAITAIGIIAGGTADPKPKMEKVCDRLTTILQERSGWNEVVRIGAIKGLAELKTHPEALNIILEYTALGIPQPLRLAAIRALGVISTTVNPPDLERILSRLQEIARETFFFTQLAVITSLGTMQTTKALTILNNLAQQSNDGRLRRLVQENIDKVMKQSGSDASIKQLREELDSLKTENRDLKSRLENLEAKMKPEN